MENIDEILLPHKIIPVAKIESIDEAKEIATRLQEQNIKIIEVTFRTKNAPEIIKYLNDNTELYVGAGTVLNAKQAQLAKENGAKFIVSPGILPEVVEFAINNNIPVFPGCVTPSEIMKALKYNINILKFFPASNYGGIKMLKALSGPFPNVKFIPTGGVDSKNKDDYLSLDNVFAVGGTWVLKQRKEYNA